MVTTNTATLLPTMILPRQWTLADLCQHLGGIPLERVRLYPPPGMATVEDALAVRDHEDRLCELVDGVLVEKVMGSYESVLAGIVIYLINRYLEANPLGVVTGEGGALRILPTKMRIPDVSFIRWDRFPNRKLPNEKVYSVAPDLAVEILSVGNTDSEMNQKILEYFAAGVRLVWYVDPRHYTARVYTAPDQVQTLDEDGTLDGGDILPGLQIRPGDLFERVHRTI